MRSELLAGLDYLQAITALKQRARTAHPTQGTYEAAELQWWWTIPRSTDDLGQLFWFDDDGPAAALTVTDFGDGTSAVYEDPTIVVTFLPDPAPDWVATVVSAGLDHLADLGMKTVEVEVDQADEMLLGVLAEHGFTRKGDGIVECWLPVDDRPPVSPLAPGYRLMSRAEVTDGRPHHLVRPGRMEIEERLHQTSLYRPDLDLVVYDAEDQVAAYGMFWHDPVTATGVVEPMRTQDDHQQRGLARHILTAGVERLAAAGAERVSIGYEPGNEASGPLYRSVGFVPHGQTDTYART